MPTSGTALLTLVGGLSISAAGQVSDSPRSQLGMTVSRDPTSQGIRITRDDLVAALPYDGSSTWGAKAQDFESAFDSYDIFIIEDIETVEATNLGEFRSVAFGTGNPFGAEDFIVRVFQDNATGLPGEDSYTGDLVMSSIDGAGHWDGQDEFVTEFGGQCLEPGRYFLVWHTRMDFLCCGQSFFLMQAGAPTIGGGAPDNAFQWNPGGAFGATHFPVIDPDRNEQTGVNYLLFGTPSNCSCSNPDCAADLDFDNDADSDDFFLFLDLFSTQDTCADIDLDGDLDADDFFAYLDLFATGCD